MRSTRGTVLFWQAAILAGVLAVWQWGYDLRALPGFKPFVPSILDPYFISKPSLIWAELPEALVPVRPRGLCCLPRQEREQSLDGD